LLERWRHPDHGRLLTPRHKCRARGTSAAGIPWAIDNDGFSGIDPEAIREMMHVLLFKQHRYGDPLCMFINVPDVFHPDGSPAHDDTLASWNEWRDELAVAGWPLAFTLQIGATVDNVPWDECGAVFIGGTTEWKLGPEARALVAEAKRRGKWVHMGRVNSKKRIAYAKAIGCDSVDGTGWAKWRDAMMPKGLAALDQQVMETGL
jgi:hypothetical protein